MQAVCVRDRIQRVFDLMRSRIRLRRVCRALKITPYGWQEQFALGHKVAFPHWRGIGKTTAVILRALVDQPESAEQLCGILSRDPDFHLGHFVRVTTYEQFQRYFDKCLKAGVIKAKMISRKEFMQALNGYYRR